MFWDDSSVEWIVKFPPTTSHCCCCIKVAISRQCQALALWTRRHQPEAISIVATIKNIMHKNDLLLDERKCFYTTRIWNLTFPSKKLNAFGTSQVLTYAWTRGGPHFGSTFGSPSAAWGGAQGLLHSFCKLTLDLFEKPSFVEFGQCRWFCF